MTSDLNARLDPEGKRVIRHYEASNAQMFVDRGRLRELGLTLADVSRHLEASGDHSQEFPRTQEEIRIGRAAETLVADGEGLVNESAARRDSAEQFREQGAMQVIGDHHQRKPAPRERPGVLLEIRQHEPDARRAGQGRGNQRITIDRRDRCTGARQKACVPSLTACHIEDFSAGPDHCLFDHPGRWRHHHHATSVFGQERPSARRACRPARITGHRVDSVGGGCYIPSYGQAAGGRTSCQGSVAA